MIDESKFEKLEKEDLEAANGGVNVGGVEYQYTKGSWLCMDQSKFKTRSGAPGQISCEYCAHFCPNAGNTSLYVAQGYCNAIIVS